MSVFQHPHLTRGIVKTAKGSFIVKRGLVDVPEEIGEELGWQLVDADSDDQRELSTLSSPDDDETPVRRGSPRVVDVEVRPRGAGADDSSESGIATGAARCAVGRVRPPMTATSTGGP